MPATDKSKPLQPAIYCIAGLVIGFAVLHPMTMLMNHHMSGSSHHPGAWTATMMDAVRESFTTTAGLVWGAVYGAVIGLIAYLLGALKSRERALRAANADLAR